MADLYSILPGILVSADEMKEAELIAVQILQAKYPDLDLREGTGARDITIRPAATLLAMANKALIHYFSNNTLKAATDDTPQETVDRIMSNLFLVRKTGTKAVINARLYFARQKALVLSSDSYFSPDSKLKFFATQAISLANGQLTFDSNNNEYYYDVDLTAEAEGADYNISSGSLLYFSNFDPFFLHAEINFLKTIATTTETNTEFIVRGKTAISTRNLINSRSITSRMLEDFSLLDGVTVIGMGDAEMIRDYVTAYVATLSPPYTYIHTGGCTDIYCRVPLTSGVVQYTTDNVGKAQLGGAIYKFKRSQISGSAIADSLPFYLTKNVSSITRSLTTATVTTAIAHNFSSGDSITIIGASPAGYNGTFIVTVTGGTTFTYTVPNTLSTPATGTITANKEVPYTTSNFYSTTQTLTSLTSVTTTATATLNSHGLVAGRWVTIAGATPSGYNGQFLITSVTQNTFTYTCPNGLSSPATGTITVTAVDPTKDFAFSDRGIQVVDFGPTYSNQTGSFLIYYFQDMDGLQQYLELETQRVVCADPLARGYNLYLLDITVTGYNGPAPDSTICSDTIKAYLKTLAPGDIFIMADLVSKLNAAGITTIKTPLGVSYTYYNRDLIIPTTGTITDFHHSNDRTAIYLLNSVTTTNTTV
jgi:hypothetical protein